MIKVLVVDDSAFMRQLFKKTIENEPDLKVIATARNGKEALKKIKELTPDVVTLDIEMPVLNGLDTLKKIMAASDPVPTIMVSALNNREIILKALEIGAFDFIPKPSGSISLDISDITKELLEKIRAAAALDKPLHNIKLIRPYQNKVKRIRRDNFPIIAIGASSGGPKALKEIIPVFPADFPAALIIVQHMPAGFTTSLAQRLNQESAITVKEATEFDRIEPGLALVAPGNYHLEVNRDGGIILNQAPPKWGVRPCVDYMLTSAGRHFKERVIGVILTGMGHDGAEGMQVVKNNHGYGIVEDKSTALVYGMPGSTIKANAYDEILPLQQIPFRIIELIERRF